LAYLIEEIENSLIEENNIFDLIFNQKKEFVKRNIYFIKNEKAN
jgi:hypothetical protein